MAYISRAGSPVSDQDFATVDEAIADFCAPYRVGAAPIEIEWLRDGVFKSRGETYDVVSRENPKVTRAKMAASAPRSKSTYRGSRWLTREMDRSNSDL